MNHFMVCLCVCGLLMGCQKHPTVTEAPSAESVAPADPQKPAPPPFTEEVRQAANALYDEGQVLDEKLGSRLPRETLTAAWEQFHDKEVRFNALLRRTPTSPAAVEKFRTLQTAAQALYDAAQNHSFPTPWPDNYSQLQVDYYSALSKFRVAFTISPQGTSP